MSPPEAGEGTSLYVHVPFCVVKCGYCDFNSYVADGEEVLDRFLSALQIELRATPWPRPPVSVFIGGGTPSFLDLRRLERLLQIVDAAVCLRECSEVTMEANPESIDAAKSALALAAGVRRISMGAQSFHAHHLRRLDRAHDAERIAAATAAIRAAGVTNLSLDLIFSLPGQTEAEWQSDLERALALDPDHLSCYALVFEPGTRLERERRRGQVQPNDQDLETAMFLHTRQRLAAAGFDAYEISNFAGRGGPCRHNDHYWLQGDYVGVGPGAASHRQGVRWTNLKPLDAWARAVEQGRPPAAEAETLSPRQRAAEALWLGLRRRAGVDLRQVARRTRVDPAAAFAAELDDASTSGWLEAAGDRLRLTASGILVADSIGSRILAAR